MHIPDKPDFESIYDDFIGNQPQPNLQMVVILFVQYHGQEDRQSAK